MASSVLLLRPNEGFSQPDYSVIWKAPDGTERDVGRIYFFSHRQL